jgi:hypothetical protein
MQEKWTPHIIAVAAFVVFIVLGLACANTPDNQENVGHQRADETRTVKVYDTVFEATRELNSRSPAMLSLARYNYYEQMPDYMKAVYDANETYVDSFRVINTFGTCWNQGAKAWVEWNAKDEESSIKLAISRLEAARRNNNSEAVDATIKRMSLGMAQNIIIAATDYLNFIVAVSNAEESYYDETTKDRLSFNADNGVFRVITREEQLLFTERYNSIKNEDYKRYANILLSVSQRLLDYLNSDLLLPIRR